MPVSTQRHEPTFDKAKVSFETLTNEISLSSLDCTDDGVKDPYGVNEFIHTQALAHQRDNLGLTLVLSYDKVVGGYATLGATNLQHRLMHDGTHPVTCVEDLASYPAVIIVNLGIDRHRRKGGLGSYWLTLLKGYCRRTIAEKVAARFLVLKSRPDEDVIRFYRDNGFILALDQDKQANKLMYVDLFPECNLPDDQRGAIAL